jgi:hypothetical protein
VALKHVQLIELTGQYYLLVRQAGEGPQLIASSDGKHFWPQMNADKRR